MKLALEYRSILIFQVLSEIQWFVWYFFIFQKIIVNIMKTPSYTNPIFETFRSITRK